VDPPNALFDQCRIPWQVIQHYAAAIVVKVDAFLSFPGCYENEGCPNPNNWHFDAYYNAATGMVQNNVEYNFQQRFLFAFQKCMADRGFPLGKKDGEH
jgi:hypothetical protein